MCVFICLYIQIDCFFQMMDTNPTFADVKINCNHKKIYKGGSTVPLTPKQLDPYLCFICNQLLFDALQLSCCGYRLCSTCLSKLQR